jgi:hypothetical protein
MAGICIVTNPKSWLILAKQDEKGRWIQKRDRIPHEIEDIRFRRATRYLELGYRFYDASKKLGSSLPIVPKDELLEEIQQEYDENPFEDDYRLDTRLFFQNLPVNPERISVAQQKLNQKLEVIKRKNELFLKAVEETKEDDELKLPDWLLT